MFLSTWTCNRTLPSERGKFFGNNLSQCIGQYITLHFFFIEPGSLKGLWDEKLGRLRIHRKTFVHFFRRWRHSKPHTCNGSERNMKWHYLVQYFLFCKKNTSASRLESSWALFRCNFRTRDRSAHSPPRLCRWDPLPGDGDDSKGDNLILLLVYFHNLWVRATTWICWFHWRTWSEGIHCHLFGICVDPRTFVLSVTQTAPPGALLVCTPDVFNISSNV